MAPPPAQQPYPGDVAGLDQTTTASVSRGAVRPTNVWNRNGAPRPREDVYADGQSYPQAASAQDQHQNFPPPARDYQVAAASLPPAAGSGLDATSTGSVGRAVPLAPPAQPLPAPAIAAAEGQGGWTRAGGTQVTVRQGETVHNLSRRFGVPVDAILKSNGLSSANALSAGQQVVIPTYVHSARAPVSAPDANPDVADARSSTGTRYDTAPGQVPLPSRSPTERLAVLPQQPKVKEPQPSSQTAAADARGNAAPAGGRYTVVPGDTLNGIARKTGVGAQALKDANGLSSGLIRVGQVLVVPAGGTVPAASATQTASVDKAPTGSVPRAEQPSAPTPVQEAALAPSAAAPDATGIGSMRWPVRGRVISGFGGTSGGKKNDGIDIAVPAGTPVKAAENGVVIYAGDGLKEFGNTVLVRHENGLVTVYGHASEINVQRGQQVRRGEEIAKAGMSGSAETPKLHFEVRKDSAPVDPAKFLE